jgi:hypothetical protein
MDITPFSLDGRRAGDEGEWRRGYRSGAGGDAPFKPYPSRPPSPSIPLPSREREAITALGANLNRVAPALSQGRRRP